jgi:4-amino-4-deoxy-L-arabinose transferase-like glycosyltransferase
MKKYFWLSLVLFLVSRFFFLANYPFFYDSPEYFRESQSVSFLASLQNSHESIHPLWLFLTQLFQKIISGNNVWELSLIAALFGLLGFMAFYLLVKNLFNQKTALLASIPLIFFPHLWLIQTNVLHESLDSGLFILALLFFNYFLDNKKKYFWLILTVIFLGLVIFDFVGILLWTPVFIGLAFLKSKKDNLGKNIIWGLSVVVVSFLIAIGGLWFLLSFIKTINPAVRLKNLLFGYGGGGIFTDWGFLNLLRTIRNDVLILFYGYSISAILGLIVSGYLLIKKKKYLLLIFILSFFLPFFLSGKFWYGGLFGRYSILIAYPLALLLALIPWRKIYALLVIILFFSFLPTFMVYQKEPVAKIQASLIKEINLNTDDLLILSDYQRPQLTYNQALYLGGDVNQQKIIEEKILEVLSSDKRVFIAQQAMDFPYWQYDGQEVHIISKGDKNKSQLKDFLKDKKLAIRANDLRYPLLTVYELSL